MGEISSQLDIAAYSDDDHISLDTLSKDEIKKIMSAFTVCRDVANDYYRETVESKIIHRSDVYDAPKAFYAKKFPKLSESSNWISRDVKTTLDWMIPSLMEVFTGSDDPIDIKGVNIEDDATAKRIQQLLKYQIERKNSYFTFVHTLIGDGLKNNFGIAKVYWRHEETRRPMQVMADAAMMMQLVAMQEAGRIEITSAIPITPEQDLLKVVYDEIIIKTNQPVIDNIPATEFRFTPEARDLHEAKFVAHRKIVKGDYLKRKEQEGIYRNVDEAIRKDSGNTRYTTLDTRDNPHLKRSRERLSDHDDASKNVELYEAYLKVDYNNDGIYENVIVHAVGDTPLSIQDNAYEMPPFFVFSPEYDPYNVFAKHGFADVLEQLQDLKTALVRQVIIAVAKNNRPQKFVNENVDMDALLDDDEIVLVKSNEDVSRAIKAPIQHQVDPLTMKLVEYSQNEIESQTGATRYNQGLDSNSLNKTATGINAIMGAADKRIRMIARIFAETTWIPLVKFLILLNQKYMDEQQIIRLTNETMAIRKDELSIDYDLIVNVGQGAGTKEAAVQQMMILIQQLYPALSQVGVVNESSWYNITKRLLETMGMRDVTNYLMDPSSPEMQQQKMIQQQQQAMAAEAKNKPRLTANFRDLPVDAKAQVLQAQGIQSSPESLIQKELLDRS